MIISILGDSISTFEGYIPEADGVNLKHRKRYPQDTLLTDVNETWWMRVINELGATLGINDSWAGSCVRNKIDGNQGDVGEDAAMASLTRIKNLGSNGSPDVILFYGGTNDAGRNYTLGEFDPENAPAAADLTAKKWDSFADSYVCAILRMKHFYPNAKIYAMTPSFTKSYYPDERLASFVDVIQRICAHYGVPCVDLRESGLRVDMLPDGLHPNATGMKCISEAVMNGFFR